MANGPARTPDGLGEPLGFMRLLWAVVHGMQRTSKHMDRELGVTGPQRLVVRVLGSLPGISAGRLADILQLHPSTLTGVLRRLEQRRLIRRSPHPDDARRAVLELDALGERVNVARAGTVEDAVRRALARVSPEQLAATRQVLELLIAELEAGLPADAASPRRRSKDDAAE